MGETALVANCVCVYMFMLSGEWNGMYYCYASQLESKYPHVTFRATAFPLRFLFPFSSQPLVLNHTMNVNAGVITLRQEISLFEWCNCLVTSCICVSLSALRFKCKLVYFQKSGWGDLGGEENDPEENHRCSSQVNPTPCTHAALQKWSRVSFRWSLYQLALCVCMCVCVM